jgi:glycosyltransferase involved in cell wall biosynthesis
MNPRVSVCIPSHNLAAYIGATIQSVLNQTFTDFELLIEDDGSTDNSVATIHPFLADPRVKLVVRAENAGQNQTTNNLVRRATGEYLALLPADDVWEPEKLAKQVAFLDANPAVGIVFSHPEFMSDAGEIIPGDEAMSATQKQGNMERAFWQKRFMVGNCLFIATSLYRRALHEEIGMFDESLHLLADLEFYARIVKNHEIHVMQERLARVRMRGALNLSAATMANAERHADDALVNSGLLTRRFDRGLADGRPPFGDIRIRPDRVDCICQLRKGRRQRRRGARQRWPTG